MSSDERNLLSEAYENSVGSRRATWRTFTDILQTDDDKGYRSLQLIRVYRSMIETELSEICQDLLALLKDVLLPRSTGAEEQVFYLKMQGDYNRYLAEISSDETQRQVSLAAEVSYKDAVHVANHLSPTNPIRLGLALN